MTVDAGEIPPMRMREREDRIERAALLAELIEVAKLLADGPTPVQSEIELMRKHLREYRRFVQSKAVDDEIKRLIGEN